MQQIRNIFSACSFIVICCSLGTTKCYKNCDTEPIVELTWFDSISVLWCVADICLYYTRPENVQHELESLLQTTNYTTPWPTFSCLELEGSLVIQIWKSQIITWPWQIQHPSVLVTVRVQNTVGHFFVFSQNWLLKEA